MKKSVQDALNEQIDRELVAAHLYLAMASYFEYVNLPGFAHWMRLQNREEIAHAMRIFDFVNDNGGRVTLGAIAKPPAEFKGALAVMKQAFKHEQKVTKSINDLYEFAVKEKAHPTALMLQWFIGEQVEEERQVTDIIARMELAGDSPPALLIIDKELGSRGPGSG